LGNGNLDSTIEIRKPDLNNSTEIQELKAKSLLGETMDYNNLGVVKTQNLPQESYNFASKLTYKQLQSNPILDIAARTWEDERYEAAKICYKSMRIIDDLIDHRKHDGGLSEAEKQEYTDLIQGWVQAIINERPQDSVQQELIETIKRFKIPLWPWQRFSKAMIYDVNHKEFKTFPIFLKYAEGAAISPASIFMHLCGVVKNNGSYLEPQFDIRKVARPAALFAYLVHIIRDFQSDQKNNLNYFAQNLMTKFGLSSSTLKDIAHGSEINPGFRKLIEKYYNYADYYRRSALHSIEIAGPYLEPRYIMSMEIIYNLYLQIFERIDVLNGTFTTVELNPTPEEIRSRLDMTIKNYDIL
jgi:phytoene synthase